MLRFFCCCGKQDNNNVDDEHSRRAKSISIVEVTRTIKITQVVKIETPMIIDIAERAITPEELTTEEVIEKIIADPDEIDFLFKPKDNERIESIEDNVEGYEPEAFVGTAFSLNNDDKENIEGKPKTCILL